jgi:hypothetical protein
MGPAFFKPAAVAGPTRVALVQKASGPTDGFYSGALVLPPVDVQAGDLILLMVMGSRSTIPQSPPVTDSDGNTYTTDYNNDNNTRAEGRMYRAVAAHTVTGLVVTLQNSSSSIYGEYVVGVYRAPAGKTWAFDSANMSAANGTFGSAPTSKTFNTSGPGVTLIGFGNGNADGGATKGQHGIATGVTIQLECPPNTTAGFGYFSFMGDILSDAALASQTVSGNIYNTNSAGDTNINRTLFVYPYTYS